MKIKILTILILTAAIFNSPAVNAQNVWVKHPTPVLSRSAVFPDWKGLATADAFVMIDNDTLKMWYAGSGWLLPADDCPHVRMGYAWSVDGINWNEYSNNPVLNISANPADFDYDGIETPTVIKDLNAPANQRYKLWYAGRQARCMPLNDHKFGYAYSPDGIHWTKYSGNPVLTPGNSADWYNSFISSPSVILEAGIYKMWFTAPDLVINGQPTDGKGNIGYATSSDGINWTVYPKPVLIAGEQANWDAASIAEPSVVKVGNTYHMFYSALDQWTVEHFQVGYATSTDGINWIKSTQNPVVKIGTNLQWDRFWASHPGVIYDPLKKKFRMWYTGRDTATITSLAGYYWDIGYCESSFDPGIEEPVIDNNSMLIYPNPANDILHVKLLFTVNNAQIKIYNQLGQLLKIFSHINDKEINMSTVNLPNGVYFMTLLQDDKLLSKKIVISR